MRITYFGHSCFLVEAQDQTRLILDPYEHGSYDGAVDYAPVGESADVVLATHEHPDHAATDTIPGDPLVLVHPVSQQVGGVNITGVQVAHDESGGEERGKNTIIIVDDGDIRLVHLGDLGHLLDEATARKIGRSDVLLVPVGGFFTIDHEAAATTIETLDPRIAIPMHYKTPKIGFPIAPVDTFLETQKTVQHGQGSTLEVSRDTLPVERTVIVLPHAR